MYQNVRYLKEKECMTAQKPVIDKILDIAKEYNIECVNFEDILDKEHLNCLWYGGSVCTFSYKGYNLSIDAIGEIQLNGFLNGQQINIVDKNSCGSVYDEIGTFLSDKELVEALSRTSGDYLWRGDGNWFEYNVFAPDGTMLELYNDNILSDNLIDAVKEGLKDFVEMVDRRTKEQKLTYRVSRDDCIYYGEEKISTKEDEKSVKYNGTEITQNNVKDIVRLFSAEEASLFRTVYFELCKDELKKNGIVRGLLAEELVKILCNGQNKARVEGYLSTKTNLIEKMEDDVISMLVVDNGEKTPEREEIAAAIEHSLESNFHCRKDVLALENDFRKKCLEKSKKAEHDDI